MSSGVANGVAAAVEGVEQAVTGVVGVANGVAAEVNGFEASAIGVWAKPDAVIADGCSYAHNRYRCL